MLERALNAPPRFSRRRFLATSGAATAGFALAAHPRLLLATNNAAAEGSGGENCEDDWIQWRLVQTGALLDTERTTVQPDPPQVWAVFEPEIPDNFELPGVDSGIAAVLKPELVAKLKEAYRTRIKVITVVSAVVDRVSYASPKPDVPGEFLNLPVWLPGTLKVSSVIANIQVISEGLAANQFTTDGPPSVPGDPSSPPEQVPIQVNPKLDRPAWVKLNGVADPSIPIPLRDQSSQELDPAAWMVEKRPCETKAPNLTIHHPEVLNSGAHKVGALKAWILYTGTLSYQIGWRIDKDKGDPNTYQVEVEYGTSGGSSDTNGGVLGGELNLKLIKVGGQKKWENTTSQGWTNVNSVSATISIAPPEIKLADTVNCSWTFVVQSRKARYRCHPTAPIPLDPLKTIGSAKWGALITPLSEPVIENPLPLVPVSEPP